MLRTREKSDSGKYRSSGLKSAQVKGKVPRAVNPLGLECRPLHRRRHGLWHVRGINWEVPGRPFRHVGFSDERKVFIGITDDELHANVLGGQRASVGECQRDRSRQFSHGDVADEIAPEIAVPY